MFKADFILTKLVLFLKFLQVTESATAATLHFYLPHNSELALHSFIVSKILIIHCGQVVKTASIELRAIDIKITRPCNLLPLKSHCYIVKLGFTWVKIIVLIFALKQIEGTG